MHLRRGETAHAAATSAEIGSHSAIVRGISAIPAIGTNVPAMNAEREDDVKPTPCIASGERTSIPNRTPAQVKANIPSSDQPGELEAVRERQMRASSRESTPNTTTIAIPSICSHIWPIT